MGVCECVCVCVRGCVCRSYHGFVGKFEASRGERLAVNTKFGGEFLNTLEVKVSHIFHIFYISHVFSPGCLFYVQVHVHVQVHVPIYRYKMQHGSVIL